ncbi:MAG TPA: TIGR03016 family PEP-CTERM system-associated outer membrane protein [Gammaproteobacteria bacterium]|nr:TIGR03016 family PEP-CTERM system-associated outer membrane protein [Gammaproteobacteria bacterium]
MLLVVVGVALPTADAVAGVLKLTPSLTLGEIYTDNLLLVPSNKTDAFVTEIEPGLNLDYEAPRLRGKIDYHLQGLVYAGHSDMNHVYNQLDANATIELLEDTLFMDGTTIYDHQVINPEKVGGRENLFGGNNRTGISATTLSPYLMHDFGAFGIATLRYAYGRDIYTSDIPNVTSNTLSFDLARQPTYGNLTYNLHYLHQRLNPDQGRDLSFEQAGLGLQYYLSAHTSLLANVGKENDFKPNGTIDRLGSNYWNVGVRWASIQNEFKILYGHRFFGKSYEFDWHHEGPDYHTDLQYREEPTDYNRLLLSRTPSTLIETQLPTDILPSLRNREIFLLKRASLVAGWDLANSKIQLNLYDERRNYIRLDQRDRVEGGRLLWNFAIDRANSIVPSYGYQRYRFRDGDINYYYRSQISWQHAINASLDFDVALRNERRNATRGVSYRVNIVMFEVTKLF